MQDIPLSATDPAWASVAGLGAALAQFADRPALLCWGMGDFVFDHTCLRDFRRAWPQAEVHEYTDAGHYVLEDAADRIIPTVKEFLQRHPL